LSCPIQKISTVARDSEIPLLRTDPMNELQTYTFLNFPALKDAQEGGTLTKFAKFARKFGFPPISERLRSIHWSETIFECENSILMRPFLRNIPAMGANLDKQKAVNHPHPD